MGARRRSLKMKINDTPDSKEEIEGMSKVEENNIESDSVQKADVLDVNQSPLMEAMIERKGGDDFLFKGQEQQQVQSEPQTTNSGTVNQEPPVNNTPPPPTQMGGQQQGGPKEFSFEPQPMPQQQNGSQGGGEQPINEIPQEISDESAKMMADMLLEGFGMVVPEAAHRYSKINEGAIRKLERDDKIQSGLVEIVKNTNDKNKNAVKVTNEQKNLIRKPLMKVLEVQGVKASPETMLAIAVIAVCAMLFIQARMIKKENDEMVQSWMADHSKSRKLQSENDKLRAELEEYRKAKNEAISGGVIESAPYAEVEVVS